jgi:hypothetical protein
MSNFVIYALLDPLDNSVRYVLEYRLSKKVQPAWIGQ